MLYRAPAIETEEEVETSAAPTVATTTTAPKREGPRDLAPTPQRARQWLEQSRRPRRSAPSPSTEIVSVDFLFYGSEGMGAGSNNCSVESSHHNTRASEARLAHHGLLGVGETGRACDHHQQVLHHNTRASELFRKSYMIHHYQHML